jgi:hypothetical protein
MNWLTGKPGEPSHGSSGLVETAKVCAINPACKITVRLLACPVAGLAVAELVEADDLPSTGSGSERFQWLDLLVAELVEARLLPSTGLSDGIFIR